MNHKLILFCCCLCAFSATAQPAAQTVVQMENYLQQYVAAGYHGSVLVASKGAILLENGYGFADREASKKQTAETVFSIGSVTKQFTAAAILKLESMGKLQLADPLSRYFPEAPSDKATITLHQLLTHSAGFPGAIGDDYETVSSAEFLKMAWETPLLQPPGQNYEYSNVGYSILGILVEKLSGQSYDAFLARELWQPAGMTRTGYLLPKFQKSELAVGYRDQQRWGTALDRSWLPDGPGWHLRANGGVLSTVGDMHRWYRALKNNTVLPKSATDKLFAPHVPEDPAGRSFYGYGWVVQTVEGRDIFWHNGGNGVYNAIMMFDLKNDLCIIVASNSNEVISDDVSLGLMAILDGKTPPPAQAAGDPMFQNPVSQTVFKTLLEKGPNYFRENSDRILKSAGFDFENDMQLLSVGKNLEEQGKWSEGVALFETYTRLFPNIVVAWNRLGVCRRETGDLPGAKAAWEQSLKLRPNGNPAKEMLDGKD